MIDRRIEARDWLIREIDNTHLSMADQWRPRAEQSEKRRVLMSRSIQLIVCWMVLRLCRVLWVLLQCFLINFFERMHFGVVYLYIFRVKFSELVFWFRYCSEGQKTIFDS